MSKQGAFSSQSCSPAGSTGAAKSQATAAVDPNDQSAKTRERDQMVGLNDKFVAFIDKVKHLEDQNKVLETRLKILLEQEDYDGKIEDIVKEQEAELHRQVGNLIRDHLKLEAELQKTQDEMENTRHKYEDEFQKKTELENDFVINKKDVDGGHLSTVALALELEDLMGELEFLRQGYDEEIKELESQVHNETVMVRESAKRALDMDEIIEGVKSQYSNMAARTRDEAEQWNQKKMDALVLSAGQHEQGVRDVKKEIADMLRLIQRLNSELETLRKKKESLEKDIRDTENNGQQGLELTRGSMVQLEEALRRAKQDMTRQIREYQELMNLKLALDIEIATYRKLLEGEERRMNNHVRQQTDIQPHLQINRRPPPPLDDTLAMGPTPSKGKLLIRVEVMAGRVVSKSSCYTED